MSKRATRQIRHDLYYGASEHYLCRKADWRSVGQDLWHLKETPELNALKALFGAPISMGRGERTCGAAASGHLSLPLKLYILIILYEMSKKEGMSMRVAIYCRIATTNQTDTDCLAIQMQKDNLISYARQKNFEITKIYTDIGYKGHDLMRPGLCEMLKDAHQRVFDAILVKNPDRLFRGNSLQAPRLPVPVICTDFQSILKIHLNDLGSR